MQWFAALEISAQKHTRKLFQLLVLSVLAFAVLLRTLHVTDAVDRSPDERLYTHFAQQIADGGLGAYAGIFSRYLADPSQWIYPSPTRVAHVLLFSGVMKLTGSSSAQAGAAVSWTLSIASVLVLAWLGRRFFNAWVGVLAAMFLALSFSDLEFARRAWGESTASFLSLCLFACTCALQESAPRRRWYGAFFVTGAACLLAKETSILAYAVCGAWLVASRLLQPRRYAAAGLLVLGGALSLLVSFSVLALLARSPRSALESLVHIFGNGLGSNEWGALHASGPWYQFLHLLWVIGPFTALMAAIGAASTVGVWLWRRRRADELSPGTLACAGLALLLSVAFVAACAFGPNLQYLRIMAPATPTYCLLAALGVWSALAEIESWQRGTLYPYAVALLPVAFGLSCLRDYGLYRDVVIGSGMQDMTARWIIERSKKRDLPALDSARRALEAAPPTSTPGAAPELAPPAPLAPATAEAELERSREHCRREEFAECVGAAQSALRGKPDMPEAWNNAAAGYAGLRLWDDAIRCASRAVALRPDFQLAKNNLAWASKQKSLAVSRRP